MACRGPAKSPPPKGPRHAASTCEYLGGDGVEGWSYDEGIARLEKHRFSAAHAVWPFAASHFWRQTQSQEPGSDITTLAFAWFLAVAYFNQGGSARGVAGFKV